MDNEILQFNSQKYENILNLAIETPEEERKLSDTLNVGYNEKEKTWQIIVRYTGSIEFLKQYNVEIIYLSINYAILTVPNSFIGSVSGFGEIIYAEMPKNLYFESANGRRVSCINEVQKENFNIGILEGGLFGEGVICAVIDSGIDYSHPAFLNMDGTTRILELWDQSIKPSGVNNNLEEEQGEVNNIPENEAANKPPEGFNIGVVYNSVDINRALAETNKEKRYEIVPSKDLSGHGTHVAGIMAGNFSADKNNNLGIATKSPLVIVKLDTTINNGFPRTTELMQAIDYVYRTSLKYKMPVSINISFGNAYGSHDGTSLIETFIDDIANLSRMSISIGTGNEGSNAGHSLNFYSTREQKEVELSIGKFESNVNIQIWKSYQDIFDISIVAPGGRYSLNIPKIPGKTSSRLGNNNILIYFGEPSPYSQFQEIYIEIIPINSSQSFISEGIWELNFKAVNVTQGRIDMWLPAAASLNANTIFTQPNPDVTLTIPSTSASAISVGAYNALTFSFAEFSGRGFTRLTNQVKPDLVAPGVNVVSAAVGGGLTERTGTSMATPFVSGSAALLMEWGDGVIIRLH